MKDIPHGGDRYKNGDGEDYVTNNATFLILNTWKRWLGRLMASGGEK